MYFKSRSEAGKYLAASLKDYRYDNCAVVALNDGGVLVGEEIAQYLHCILTMLLIEEIEVPGEQMLFGTVDQNGGFVYNRMFSLGEFEEYYAEFHGYLDDQKRQKFQIINRLLGEGGILDDKMLKGHVVILVSDGLPTGASLDTAAEFLKHIKVARFIVATPVASIPAVDRMHVVADELHVLNVASNYLATNHYYDDNSIPSHEETVEKLNKAVLNWKN
jgi:putative phosphoribosyl transferase